MRVSYCTLLVLLISLSVVARNTDSYAAEGSALRINLRMHKDKPPLCSMRIPFGWIPEQTDAKFERAGFVFEPPFGLYPAVMVMITPLDHEEIAAWMAREQSLARFILGNNGESGESYLDESRQAIWRQLTPPGRNPTALNTIQVEMKRERYRLELTFSHKGPPPGSFRRTVATIISELEWAPRNDARGLEIAQVVKLVNDAGFELDSPPAFAMDPSGDRRFRQWLMIGSVSALAVLFAIYRITSHREDQRRIDEANEQIETRRSLMDRPKRSRSSRRESPTPE